MVDYDKFINSDDPVQELEQSRGDITYSEWKRAVARTVSDGGLSAEDKIELFGHPIEAFCTDKDSVEIVDTIAIDGVPEEEIRKTVDYLLEKSDKDPFNKAIGIHTTEEGNVDEILNGGFNPSADKYSAGSNLRDGSTFFWIHSTDIGEMLRDNPMGILILAPQENVKVSSYLNFDLLTGGYITVDEYEQHHVLDYIDYAEALYEGARASKAHGIDTLL